MSGSEDQSIEMAERKLSEMKKFIFTKEKLKDSPSFKCGMSQSRELEYRYQAARFCQDLGQNVGVLVKFFFIYLYFYRLFYK